jgi:predicted peptidase
MFLSTIMLVASFAGGDAKTGFVNKIYKGKDGDSKYVVFVPHAYKGDKEYPLILFLHGAGERGDDGMTPVLQGIANAGIKLKDKEKSFGFFVVFPQARVKGSWKAGDPDANRAVAILEEVQKEYKIDAKRLYLTGLSMGGSGTWSLAAAHPDKWAAIAPICGRGEPDTASKIKDIPTWAFCGDQDNAKLVEANRTMIKALQGAGGKPRYSEYPFVGHNSWDSAYATPELYTWFLKQSTKGETKKSAAAPSSTPTKPAPQTPAPVAGAQEPVPGVVITDGPGPIRRFLFQRPLLLRRR